MRAPSRYYETREPGLGRRLIDEVDVAVAQVMEFPAALPIVREAPPELGLRWVPLPSFPIKLVYVVRSETLNIVAMFHAHRRPGYWLERLNH